MNGLTDKAINTGNPVKTSQKEATISVNYG